MTIPFRHDTPFRKKARALRAPNSPDFDLTAWATAAAKCDELTYEDRQLLVTALWLANEAKSHREYYAANPLPRLSQKSSMILTVAAVNQQSDLMARKAEKARLAAREAGGMAMDYLTHIKIHHGGSFETDIASFTDAVVDAADSWLYETADKPEPNPEQTDLDKAVGRLMLYFSGRRSHYDIWQQVIWENFELHNSSEDKNTLILMPADPELRVVLDACNHRSETNALGYAWVDMSAWPTMDSHARRKANLPRTVVAMERPANKARHFIVARPTTDTPAPPYYMLGRAQLDISYLSGFMDRPFPKNPDLCLDILVRAWFVVRDLAEVLAKARPAVTFRDMANIRAWALAVKKAELIDVVTRALDLEPERALQVVEFLSWRKGCNKGLWGAPLVPLAGTEDMALVQPVLDSTNMARTAEVWLANGGLDDSAPKSARGDIFERSVRSSIRAALAKNTIVADSACAEHAIKKDKRFPEEIDLLVQFGSLLLVGEVKCFSFPADSRERHNHLRKLREASGQAIRKAKAITARPDVTAKALGIDEDKVKGLTVTPIVMVNQGFGVSLEFDGCVVTDSRILDLYLRSGRYDSEVAVDRKQGGSAHKTLHLYRTPKEAIERFAATMRKPPALQRFVDRLSWTSMTLPTSKNGVALLVAHTQLADVTGETRQTYETLTEMLSQPADVD